MTAETEQVHHTPGPWKWTAQESCITDESGADCVVCFGHNYDDYGGIWNGADARLIAAAPRMLDMLIRAIEGSGFSVSGPTDWRAAEHGEPAWVCEARAVIAEATNGNA